MSGGGFDIPESGLAGNMIVIKKRGAVHDVDIIVAGTPVKSIPLAKIIAEFFKIVIKNIPAPGLWMLFPTRRDAVIQAALTKALSEYLNVLYQELGASVVA